MSKGNIYTKIPSELVSVASNGIVVSADGVHDYVLNKDQETINSEKANKSETVSNVSYSNGKLSQTINGTTTEVVDLSSIGSYEKPSGGIPSTDLTSEILTSLGKADTAYQKPSGGIPASDLAFTPATLTDGKVPASQLPSYVDDVIEVETFGTNAPSEPSEGDLFFNTSTNKLYVQSSSNWVELTPAKGIIYVNSNKIYRWSGSTMIEISSDTNTFRKVKVNGSDLLLNSDTTDLNLVLGNGVAISGNSNGSVTISSNISVFSDSANGLAPAASNANKTTAEESVDNYYLCADGKYRQLPANAFNDHTYAVMGASGSSHASGLVPDPGSTAGTTKFLREDGTWAEPAGGGGGGNITVESNSAPTSSTTTYTKDGVTKNYVVGDKIIIPNAQSNSGYEVYILLNITGNTATWGAIDADDGRVIVTVRVYDNNDTNLALTSASISVNGGTATAMAGVTDTTGHKKTFTATGLEVGDEYVVTFGSVSGYLKPSDINWAKETTSADIFAAAYNDARVIVAVGTYDNDDTALATATATIAINGRTATAMAGTLDTVLHKKTFVANLSLGDAYVISFGSIEDYRTPANIVGTKSAETTAHNVVYGQIQNVVPVDLGLTSGTLWAPGNIIKDGNGNYYVGEATEYGCVFSWGNVDGHPFAGDMVTVTRGQNQSTYPEGTDGFVFREENYWNWSTFVDDLYNGSAQDANNDGYYEQDFGNGTPGMLLSGDIASNDSTYDAAAATLGGDWHMPSKDDFQELLDETDHEWVENFNNSGVNGYKFMKKSNNSVFIFMPTMAHAGFGEFCELWSSSFYGAWDAWDLGFISENMGVDDNGRYLGFPVRAVQ